MKVGMNLLLWTGAAKEAHLPLLEDIKAWGFDGVEFPMFAADCSPWRTFAQVCGDLGLGETAVVVLPQHASLIGESESEREAALDFLKSCVDSCVELSADTLCGPIYSPVGKLVGRGPNDDERKRAAEGLRALGEYAQESGVAIAVEPLNRFETYFLNTQADAADLVDQVGIDCVGVLYDTFHANIEEKDVSAAIATASKRIKLVHISANDRATPGEDHVDWPATFAALKKAEYDGWMVIESFGSWIPELAGATCIWRKMAPSEAHIAQNGLKLIRESWAK